MKKDSKSDKKTEKVNFNDKSWRSILPEVYGWADSVKVDATSQLDSKNSAKTLTVVVVDEPTKDKNSDKKTSDETIEFKSSQLSSDLGKSCSALLQDLCWKKSGGILVTIDSRAYLVVASTKLKVTVEQKSRAVGLEIAKHLKAVSFESVNVVVPKFLKTQEILIGLGAGLYSAGAFKSAPKPSNPVCPAKVSFIEQSKTSKEDFASALHLIKVSTFVRHIEDAPSNYLDPVRFGNLAADAAKEFGVKCRIMGRKDIEKLKMGSFLSVNNGSVIEPRLIVLEVPGKNKDKTLALCGKGLTFDTGGISIKPSGAMEEMKYDMCGGAVVLGTALYLAKYPPATNVVCIIGATENMCSATATKPGDIVVAMNGKTIEVQNTDAEGRLVLADLLHYANAEFEADMIVDVATLTGAVLVALGTIGSAVMSNDEDTAQLILNASKSVGEPFWELPFWPEFDQEAKGATADLNNIAKPNVKAGTIMGGVFLKEFVDDTPWAHLDIAGTGWDCKATGYPPSGGSAFGLRTLIETAKRFK